MDFAKNLQELVEFKQAELDLTVFETFIQLWSLKRKEIKKL